MDDAMRYFLPDWDDRVDPSYDFDFDLPSVGRDPYRDDMYAHEYFGDDECYDGILVSRFALSKNGAKAREVNRVGLRRYLRLPKRFELMGDCGAFGYIDQREPIFETAELVEFYARSGVDYGVSVDHIIFPAFPDQRQYRYDLTIRNGIEFLRCHRANGHTFTPVGALQGWDPSSYAEAARRLARAGYRMLAVGGLVRSRTTDILAIARAVTETVGPSVRVHLFGVARERIIPELAALGIFSFDSASPMRTSWMSATKNFLLGDASYTAIRIPFPAPERQGVRGDNILTRANSDISFAGLQHLEKQALAAVRAYSQRTTTLSEALGAIEAFDREQSRRSDAGGARDIRMQQYRKTLLDRPWTSCDCRVCKDIGVEVVIFRGNNRNRRRGFHNVREFYKTLKARERAVHSAPTQQGLGLYDPLRNLGDEVTLRSP
jgi:hypothetical protein